MKSKKKAKDKEKKEIDMNSRKHLSNLRVLQRNLVYIIGIPSKIAHEDVLQRPEFFGQFGRIVKTVVNKRNLTNPLINGQAPTASVYITYYRKEDAAKVIQHIDGSLYEGRILKATYGTTKYCSFFLRGIQCQNPGCMYLHEQGDDRDSFTKEEMTANKHHFHENDKIDNRPVQKLGTLIFKDVAEKAVDEVVMPAPRSTPFPMMSQTAEAKIELAEEERPSRSFSASVEPPRAEFDLLDFSFWKTHSRQFSKPEQIIFDPFRDDLFSAIRGKSPFGARNEGDWSWLGNSSNQGSSSSAKCRFDFGKEGEAEDRNRISVEEDRLRRQRERGGGEGFFPQFNHSSHSANRIFHQSHYPSQYYDHMESNRPPYMDATVTRPAEENRVQQFFQQFESTQEVAKKTPVISRPKTFLFSDPAVMEIGGISNGKEEEKKVTKAKPASSSSPAPQQVPQQSSQQVPQHTIQQVQQSPKPTVVLDEKKVKKEGFVIKKKAPAASSTTFADSNLFSLLTEADDLKESSSESSSSSSPVVEVKESTPVTIIKKKNDSRKEEEEGSDVEKLERALQAAQRDTKELETQLMKVIKKNEKIIFTDKQ